MSIRRRNIHRSRSQDASQQAQQLHHRITADWAVSGPFSTQLVPYSPWRVILYKRPMGQAVLYNQDNDAVEVQSIVSRTRPQPLAPVSVAGNQNNSLAVAAKNRDSAVSMPQHRISVCPTCLQIVPAHAAGGWEQQINAISSNGVESDTVADREYFKLLARSLRPHRVSLELPGTHGELRPETSYNGSDDEDQSHRAVPATAGAVTGSPSLDVIGYDHDVLSPISLLESKGRGATAGEEESKSPGGVAASSFNQGYYERFFVEQKKLGKGLRGSVFSCQHILDSVYLGQYAVKKVAVGNNHQWLKRMLREVKLLESLRHPNVIEYKHSWLEMHQLTNFGPNVPCLFILMEYANGGNLQEFMEPRTPSLLDAGNSTSEIKQRILRMRRQSRQGKSAAMTANHTLDSGELDGGRRTLTIDQIWSLFSDICSGLAHLHQLQIIHRDLKHMNLLLHWKDPAHKDTSGEVPRILLTDFGECEVLSHVEKRDRTGATGTLEFMPPELIAVDDMGRFLDSYSTKSDMWSLGMVFYYLCYSSLPYSNIDNIDVLRKAVLGFTHVDFAKAQRPNGAEAIPLEMRKLMQRLLNHDEDMRPDIAYVLRYVRENKTLWHSRYHDESRFELHDSDMASNGGDTPGMRTPQLRSTAVAIRSRPSMGTAMMDSTNGIGASTVIDSNPRPVLGLLRRHSIGEPSHSSRQSSMDFSQWTTDDSWAEIENAVVSSSGASASHADTAAINDLSSGEDGVNPVLIENGTKRAFESSDVGSTIPSKRQRLAATLSVDQALCLRIAILLAKMYVVQGIDAASERQHLFAQWVAALTLIASAVDIHCRSMRLSLILLGANICLLYIYRGFMG